MRIVLNNNINNNLDVYFQRKREIVLLYSDPTVLEKPQSSECSLTLHGRRQEAYR